VLDFLTRGFQIPLDIQIAVGLVVITLVVFLLSRIKILPKKSLPFIAAALLGAFGFSVFKQWRQRGLRKELREKEKQIKEKEKRLDELKAKADASEQELRRIQADLNKERAALQKEILIIEEKNKAEKERIENLPDDELFEEFDRAFGGE